MSPQARKPRQAGFTLLEVLIALTIAGVVSLIAMQGIALATNGVMRLSQKTERAAQRHGLEMRLRRALAATIAAPILNGRPSFIGDAASMSFLSIAESGGAGLYKVTLAFRASLPSRPVILRRELADPATGGRIDEGVLAHDIKAFSLAYFGAATPADKPAWQTRWQARAQPPQLIRLTLDDGDGVEHPPIIIRLLDAP